MIRKCIVNIEKKMPEDLNQIVTTFRVIKFETSRFFLKAWMCSKSRTCVWNAYVNVRTFAFFSKDREKEKEICLKYVPKLLDIWTFNISCHMYIAGDTANINRSFFIQFRDKNIFATKISRMIIIYCFPTLQKRSQKRMHYIA